MRDSNKLWTPYGLRSTLQGRSHVHEAKPQNTTPPTGGDAIWININYLAVRALHHYGNAEGPYQEKAAALYEELRTNIINNVHRQYVETGYIWEQYNDSTGRGQGSHPFTGWSALTVLMMAEQYWRCTSHLMFSKIYTGLHLSGRDLNQQHDQVIIYSNRSCLVDETLTQKNCRLNI